MEQVLLFAIGGNGCFVQLNKDFGRNKTILINVEKADQERYVRIVARDSQKSTLTLTAAETTEMCIALNCMEELSSYFRKVCFIYYHYCF